MMSFHSEKISKDQQRFLYRFGRDPRSLQLLFLSYSKVLLADPATKGGEPGSCPIPKFSKTCSVVRYSIKLQAFL